MNVAAIENNVKGYSLQSTYFKSKRALLIWTLFAGLLLFSFTSNSFVINISLLLSVFCFGELILALGKIVPIKEITALLMVVQLLLAPYLDYKLLAPQKISAMVISQDTYFSFALPAVLAFIVGMRIKFKRSKFLQGVLEFSKTDLKVNSKIGVSLIIIGYAFLILQRIWVFPGLEFLFVILTLLRFVGVFYLMFSDNSLSRILILAVIIPTTITTIKGSVFIDLLIWLFYIFALAAIKFNLKTRTSLIIVVSSTVFLMILQSVKIDYRKIEWSKNRITQKTTGVDLFTDLFSERVQSINKNNLWIMQAKFINRLNQGFIVSYIMRKNVANKMNQSNFFSRELLGIFLPRFIYSDKATVGSNEKFRYLTGIPLATSVTMNVGILGDGFGNYGFAGGILFCFSFGLFLNLVIGYCFTLSRRIKTILFWMPLILFYVMRAGNEFYIITNWTVKVALVVVVYYFISKRIFGKPI